MDGYRYLDRDGNAGEKSVVPVEFCEQLAHHDTHGNHLAAACFRVNFLVVTNMNGVFFINNFIRVKFVNRSRQVCFLVGSY